MVRGGGGHAYLTWSGYKRGPAWGAAPFRVYRVLRDARKAIPAPIYYLLAAFVGVGLGIGLQLVVGWPWWMVAAGVVAAVWLAYMVTAFQRMGAALPETLGTQLRDALDPKGALARYDGRMEAVVRSPPFPLYGLSDSWRGPRFIGGVGWGGMGRKARIERIELAHDDPLDPASQDVRVESSIAHPALPREMVLRDLAEGLWHETDQPPPDLPPERFRAWVDARDREVRTRETPSFRTVEIPVDGRRVPFDYLAIGSAWVARGSVGQVTLTLVGRNLDVSGLELVTVTDAEPYIRGTRQFHDELSDDAD